MSFRAAKPAAGRGDMRLCECRSVPQKTAAGRGDMRLCECRSVPLNHDVGAERFPIFAEMLAQCVYSFVD
jgi:hypothetical protein